MSSCGWCLDGLHDKCIGAVRIRDDELHFCTHPKRNPTLRCVECSNTTKGEVDPTIWECLDEHRGPQRLRRAARETDQVRTATPRPPKPPKPTPTGPKCACECGGRTRGGKFLPGHDSRYISQAVLNISDGTKTLTEVLTHMETSGMSEALQKKLQKRLGK